MQIVDVSDPATPDELGFLDTPGDAQAVVVVVRGDKVVAFVANDYYGVRVIDVTNPAQPVEISHLPQEMGGVRSGIAVYHNYVYVTSGLPDLDLDGVYVMDISDLDAPRFVGMAHARRSTGVTIKNGPRHVTGDNLTVFDLADPVRPVNLGAYDSTGPVAVADDLAYHPNFAQNSGRPIVSQNLTN
ncbi:MAG: hypothetical protein R2844_09155 [Caldilineales bacterium]